MKIFFTLAILLACFQLFAEGNQANRSIQVSGIGDIRAEPDVFSFSVHIERKGVEAGKLNKIVKQCTRSLIETVINLGVTETSIQALQVRFNPWMEYENKKNVQKGFSLSRKININVNDLELYGKVIDSLLDKGITRIDGFNYSSSKSVENYQAALEQALLNAKSRATAMAKTLGLKLGKVITISEQSNAHVTPMKMSEALSVRSSAFQPGEMSTQARVTVTFGLID